MNRFLCQEKFYIHYLFFARLTFFFYLFIIFIPFSSGSIVIVCFDIYMLQYANVSKQYLTVMKLSGVANVDEMMNYSLNRISLSCDNTLVKVHLAPAGKSNIHFKKEVCYTIKKKTPENQKIS